MIIDDDIYVKMGKNKKRGGCYFFPIASFVLTKREGDKHVYTKSCFVDLS